MTAELKASRSDAILVLSFSHPGRQNAPDGNVLAAAVETFSKAERDDAVRAVVLTGADGDFCGGIHTEKDFSAQMSALENLHSLIEVMRSFPKPVIAAVEGCAINAGFSLALACDLIVAAQSSRFALNATHDDSGAIGGASWFLQKALPPQLIAEIFLDAQPVAVNRLQAAGLINKLVADGMALDQALAWAEQLAFAPASRFERLKIFLNGNCTEPLSEVFISEKHKLLART